VNAAAPATTFVPPLQKKEARPIGALAFLWFLFLLPIGSCGSMATYKLSQGLSDPVVVTDPSKLRDVKPGQYLSADLTLTHLATDEFPLDGKYVFVAKGVQSFSVAGAPDTVVIATSDPPLIDNQPRARVHVDGQMCDESSAFACKVPENLDTYLRAMEKARKGTKVLAVIAHARPHDALVESTGGFIPAGIVLVLGLVATWLLLRAASKPGVLAFSREVTLASGAEAVRAKLRAQANPMCRIAHDGADRIVLLVGKTMAQARLMGAREPTHSPLRVDVSFGAADAYRGGAGQVSIFALFGTPGSSVVPSGAQPAVQAAAAWIVSVCETP